MDEEGLRVLRRYLERWQQAGLHLHEERTTRLRALTDSEARERFSALAQMWQPSRRETNGDGIVQAQRVFRLYHHHSEQQR